MQKNNRLHLTLVIYVLSLFILSGLVRAFDTNKIIDINLEYNDKTQWNSVLLEDVEQ